MCKSVVDRFWGITQENCWCLGYDNNGDDNDNADDNDNHRVNNE